MRKVGGSGSKRKARQDSFGFRFAGWRDRRCGTTWFCPDSDFCKKN